MNTKVTTVTPAMAKQWLDATDAAIQKGIFRQRALSESTIDRYANDIRSGNWELTHQGIAKTKDNIVLDGRHRLSAIARTKIPVVMQVTDDFELPAKNGRTMTVMDAMDVGKNRSIGNQLAIGHGFTNANTWSSMVNGLVHFTLGTRRVRLTVANVITIASQIFPEELEYLVDLATHHKAISGPWIVAPLVYYRAAYPIRCKEFCESYFSMENMSKGSPEHMLHRWLNNNRWRLSQSDRRIEAMKTAAWAIQSHYNHETVETMRQSNESRVWLLNLNKQKMTNLRNMFRTETEKLAIRGKE